MNPGSEIIMFGALFQQKALTEKYIGRIDFDWIYSAVKYTAKCTIGIPFDLFDKAIVGILQVDEVLSIEQIGEILGMNVSHNPENKEYKDDAEYDILRMALDSLKSFGVIETGDIYYSACRLTDIGKEYAKKERKFKIENNKPFTLYYDHTSGNHTEAKNLFQSLKGKNQALLNEFNFLDESLMKQIAEIQAPEVYDPEKGNSFISPQIGSEKSQTFSLRLYIALLYNLATNQIRLCAFEPTTRTIHETFSKWLNENKKDEILEHFVNTCEVPENFGCLSEEYILGLIQAQSNLEKLIDDNAEQVMAEAKRANMGLDYVDSLYFWNYLGLFASQSAKEMWFFLPDTSQEQLAAIEEIAKKNQSLSIFFVFSEKTENEDLEKQIQTILEKSSLLDYNLLAIRENVHLEQQFRFWIIEQGVFELNSRIVGIAGTPFTIEVFEATNKSRSDEIYRMWKTRFAFKILPLFSENFEIAVDQEPKESEITKSRIIDFSFNLDLKAQIFSDLHDQKEVLRKIGQIEARKNAFINKQKERHSSKLRSDMEKLKIDFEQQEISKLENLQKYSDELTRIEKEFFPEYEVLYEISDQFRAQIYLEETRIKDEVIAKFFIIDTNVFIEYPDVVSKIDPRHHILLSHTVIDELDKLKQKEKLREKATSAIKKLNRILGKNKQLRTAKANTKILGEDYRKNSPDNRILSVAYMYKDNNPVLLTNDNGLQLKAKSLNIPTISLKEFLSVQEAPKASNHANGMDYLKIFKHLEADKNGKYHISRFIGEIKKQYPEFDYKDLGFEKAWQFVKTLEHFKVIENQFLILKN